MKKIKIGFSDFWGGFDYNPTGKSDYDNIFHRILSEKYDIEIDNHSPDFLIYSVFGNSHESFKNCKKIFYTGENRRPDFTKCDYAITFDHLDDSRHHRFPLSAIILIEKGIKEFSKDIDFESIKRKKSKFCNFVFSNPGGSFRNNLFHKLSKYKRVDAGGAVLNNIGSLVGDKLEFIDRYKFTIAFENSEYPGYTTEKIVHPKLVNSIPIYWGNPLVGNDWNSKGFINYYDYMDTSKMIEFIKEVDNNDSLYYEILSQPHYKENVIPKDHDINLLLEFFERIFNL
jgi:hypothetical protein